MRRALTSHLFPMRPNAPIEESRRQSGGDDDGGSSSFGQPSSLSPSPDSAASLAEVQEIIGHQRKRWTEETASEAVRQATLSAILSAAVYASEAGDASSQEELQRALARLAGVGSRAHRARRVASYGSLPEAAAVGRAMARENTGSMTGSTMGSMTESMGSSWSSSAVNAASGGNSNSPSSGTNRDLLSRTRARMGRRLSIRSKKPAPAGEEQHGGLSLDERLANDRRTQEVEQPEQPRPRKLSMRLPRKLSFSGFSSSSAAVAVQAVEEVPHERRLSFTSMINGNRRKSFREMMGGVNGIAAAAAARLSDEISPQDATGSSLANGGKGERPNRRRHNRGSLIGRNPERMRV